jgi:excisionase family DNA binding protein
MPSLDNAPTAGPEQLTYTVPEAARVLRVHPNTVRRWIEVEGLPIIRTSTHRTLIPVRKLAEWVDSRSGSKGDAA